VRAFLRRDPGPARELLPGGAGLGARAAAWCGLGIAAYLGARSLLPSGLPAGILLQGAVLGGLSSLVAMGLVLLYRAARFVNFAQAAIGALGATLATSLAMGPGWPYAACLICGLGLSLLTGLVLEALVHWRFERAPRLVLIVATIGMLQVIGAVQVGLPHAVGLMSSATAAFTTPFSVRFSLSPLVFNGNDVAAMAAVPLCAAALWTLLSRTDTGLVIRAAADSRERALLLGLPVRRSSRVVWLVASGLSAVGAILSAPIVQPVAGTASSPVDLLAPLAAAALARFGSLRATAAWSLVIGVVQQAVFWSFHSSTYADVTVLLLIAAGFGLQRRSSLREQPGASFGDWVLVREAARLPSRIRALPEVRVGRAAGSAAVLLAAVLVPLGLTDAQTGPMSEAAIYAMIAVSLVVLTGWSGQVSLGQFAFAGLGAACTGALLVHAHADLFVSLLASAAVGALSACVVGLPALRLSGIQLAVVTLAFAVVVSEWILSPEYFAGLNPLQVGRPVLFGRISLESHVAFYEVCLAALLVSLLLARNLSRTRVGRALRAVRESPRDAAAFGIEPWRQKLTAFVFSGALAGTAGGLYVVAVGGTGYGGIDPTLSLTVLSMAVVGGLGSLSGALVGAAYIWAVVTFLPTGWALLTSGAGLLVLLGFFPEGIAGLLFRLRDVAVGHLARRRGLPAPGGRLAGSQGPAAQEGTQPERSDDGGPGAPPAGVPELAGARPGRPPPGGSGVVLSVDGLDVALGPTKVLSGVSASIARGEALALVGANGAGKSTLLRAIGGLVPVQAGEIRWEGEELSSRSPAERVRAGLAVVLGGRSTLGSLTVAENLRIAGWAMRRCGRADELREAEREVRLLFPALQAREHVLSAQLSGGEQQMLAIAQGLLCCPKLLLVDELSLGLAPTVVSGLIEALRASLSRGVSVLLVEQSLEVAAAVARRTVLLERGVVRYTGPTEALARSGTSARRGAHARDGAHAGSGSSVQRAPGLELQRVSRSFGGVCAVSRVSLAVSPGEIVGLIGANGAGKTTLLDLGSGIEACDEGRVILMGEDVTASSAAARAARGLGRTFQDTWIFPSLTVSEALAVASDRHAEVRDPLLCCLWTYEAAVSERRLAARVGLLLEELSLSELADVAVRELSTGLRRAVALACAVAFEPRICLLDEPSSGLAERERDELVGLLGRLRDRTGAGFVVIDHDLGFVRSLVDRLAFMSMGMLLAEGMPAEVLADPGVMAAYAGGPALEP
jgi:branched-chain amino acid transport system permease protein